MSKVRLPSSLDLVKTPNRWVRLNCGLPACPRFVVMITTPLVAFDP